MILESQRWKYHLMMDFQDSTPKKSFWKKFAEKVSFAIRCFLNEGSFYCKQKFVYLFLFNLTEYNITSIETLNIRPSSRLCPLVGLAPWGRKEENYKSFAEGWRIGTVPQFVQIDHTDECHDSNQWKNGESLVWNSEWYWYPLEN